MAFWLFTNSLCKNISGSSEKQQLFQYLSCLPLNAFSDGADTTSSGTLLNKLTTWKEKKMKSRMRCKRQLTTGQTMHCSDQDMQLVSLTSKLSVSYWVIIWIAKQTCRTAASVIIPTKLPHYHCIPVYCKPILHSHSIVGMQEKFLFQQQLRQ